MVVLALIVMFPSVIDKMFSDLKSFIMFFVLNKRYRLFLSIFYHYLGLNASIILHNCVKKQNNRTAKNDPIRKKQL